MKAMKKFCVHNLLYRLVISFVNNRNFLVVQLSSHIKNINETIKDWTCFFTDHNYFTVSKSITKDWIVKKELVERKKNTSANQTLGTCVQRGIYVSTAMKWKHWGCTVSPLVKFRYRESTRYHQLRFSSHSFHSSVSLGLDEVHFEEKSENQSSFNVEINWSIPLMISKKTLPKTTRPLLFVKLNNMSLAAILFSACLLFPIRTGEIAHFFSFPLPSPLPTSNRRQFSDAVCTRASHEQKACDDDKYLRKHINNRH